MSSTKIRKASLSYNSKGQLKHYFYPSDEKDHKFSFEYYSNGDIKSISIGNSNSTKYDKRDLLGNCTWVKYPDGSMSHYEYDKRGRLSTLVNVDSTGLADTTKCKYNYEGKIIQLALPGENLITYTFDNHGWLTEVNSNMHGITKYKYDTYGRILDKTILSPNGDTLQLTAYD